MNNASVIQVLNSLPKNEIIYYQPCPGNAGDGLIAAGAFTLFDQIGLNIEVIKSTNFDSTNKIVIYAGGGNLVGIYSDAKDFISKQHKAAKMFILLPHTVTNNDELLAELGENTILFAREMVTYQYLQNHAQHATVYIDHDLAFHLKPEKLLEIGKTSIIKCAFLKIFYKITKNYTAYKNTPQPAVMNRYSNFESKRLMLDTKSGNFFRTDVESIFEKIPDNNMDLSNLYEGATTNKDICYFTVGRLMQFINKFEIINTDRLHICIAAALLGKKVNFYSNSYFKCKAIYEYSLENSYPNVTWKGSSLENVYQNAA